MNKKILIGSIIAVALLLLMPSIPAIQQKTVEDGVRQDLQEKLDEINLDDLKDIIDLDTIKHPILYYLVMLFTYIQALRFIFFFWGGFVWFTSPDPDYPYPIVENPVLLLIFYIRSIPILATIVYWTEFWNYVSELLGWDWDVPSVFLDD